jgi:hypothetical protein
MHIEFSRTGGFTGIRLAGSFDTQQLLPEQASILNKLIEDAGFFNLPEEIKPTSPGPDRFQYQITISSAQQAHTVSVSEALIPVTLNPLIDYLTTLATKTNKQ